MADTVNVPTRSRMMAGIKGKNTGPEQAIRKGLHRLGLRFRLHARDLPGRPDIVLPRHRAVVLVHGCFWHRHGCRLTATPSSNTAFWEAKFAATVERDQRQHRLLLEAGWRVATIWECAVRETGAVGVTQQVAAWLRGGEVQIEVPGCER